MKLGILVNTNRHLDHVLGIIRAALSKNHEVMVFVMDEGIHLFGDPSFSDLAGADNVSMSICRHSAERLEIETENLAEEITAGSQFENALMAHDADRMIVL